MKFKIDIMKSQGKNDGLNIYDCDNKVECLEKIRIKSGLGSN